MGEPYVDGPFRDEALCAGELRLVRHFGHHSRFSWIARVRSTIKHSRGLLHRSIVLACARLSSLHHVSHHSHDWSSVYCSHPHQLRVAVGNERQGDARSGSATAYCSAGPDRGLRASLGPQKDPGTADVGGRPPRLVGTGPGRRRRARCARCIRIPPPQGEGKTCLMWYGRPRRCSFQYPESQNRNPAVSSRSLPIGA